MPARLVNYWSTAGSVSIVWQNAAAGGLRGLGDPDVGGRTQTVESRQRGRSSFGHVGQQLASRHLACGIRLFQVGNQARDHRFLIRCIEELSGTQNERHSLLIGESQRKSAL